MWICSRLAACLNIFFSDFPAVKQVQTAGGYWYHNLVALRFCFFAQFICIHKFCKTNRRWLEPIGSRWVSASLPPLGQTKKSSPWGWPRLRSRPLTCHEKKNEGMLVSIVPAGRMLVSRREKLNLVVIDFLAPWLLRKNLRIACHVLIQRGSTDRARSRSRFQRSAPETSEGMCMSFRVHWIRPEKHESREQSMQLESWPGGPIHCVWMELSMPRHLCM